MSLLQPIPRISIVTPSLNQGRFIQQCIDSVATQDWAHIEHFVVDGGSTDETIEILERNKKRLSGYISEPDNGAADAINKGFARCSGDIVAWLNADDFLLPDAFQKVAKAWHEYPTASFWFGNGLRVDEAGKVKAAFNSGKILYNREALKKGLDYILQPATFINPRALNVVGYLDVSLRWGFDWDLWIRLAEVNPPTPIQDILAASREWGDTLTANGGFRRAEELRRISENYSGSPLSPGAACYWLDTFSNAMKLARSDFSETTLEATRELWRNIQLDMSRLGVDASGMPTCPTGLNKPMVIGVDLYSLIPGTSGGIVPWIKGVLRALARHHPTDNILMFHRSDVSPIQLEEDNVTYIELPEHPVAFYEAMTKACRNKGIQVIIRSYPLEVHPDFPFERQIFVIPDIQHEYFPEFFSCDVLASRRRAFTKALASGGAIATMTNHSRSTIMENSATLCDDVFLMPAALPEELLTDATNFELPEPVKAFTHYFYMPANLWAHKNHRRLLQAFEQAQPNLPEGTGLVLTGNPAGFSELIADFPKLPVLHLGFLQESQVAALYKNTAALVYFSLFEGFGMPVLEALKHGAPVLCSNTTSLPEVGGDAVLTCDPTDIQAMAELMRSVFENPNLIADVSVKASGRVASYTWDDSACALYAAIKRRLLAKPRKTKNPLISIVMPTRNHARFIRNSINSVLTQDYPNFELIVMDGASTDTTVEILETYGDKIRWISEPDNGQADAINKGLKLANGEVLTYLNSDDLLLPGALATVAKEFESCPERDMIYGDADYIDENGAIIGEYPTAEFSFGRLMQDCCVCQPAAFWRKRIAQQIGTFDADLQTAMDYDYWLRMAVYGANIKHMSKKLAQSRLHADAKTLAMRGKIFEEVFQICKKHGGYVSFSYYCGLWSYRIYETWSAGQKLRQICPYLYQAPALVHFSLQVFQVQRDRSSRRHLARNVFNIIENHSPFVGTSIRKAWRGSSFLRRRFS